MVRTADHTKLPVGRQVRTAVSLPGEDGPHSGPYETLLGAWSEQRTLQNWSRPGEVPLKGGEVGQVRVVVAVEAGGEA
jgi:hypothetical protein